MTFLDASQYPFARALERHADAIRAEAAAVDLAEYETWTIAEAYEGLWRIFPMFSSKEDWDFAPMCARNRERCPRTAAVLKRIPGLLLGGFSTLDPGSHIKPHADFFDRVSVRSHLGLQVNDRCTMSMAGEDRRWEPGRVLAFDGRTPHEARNAGDEPRIVLLVDVAEEHAREPLLPA